MRKRILALCISVLMIVSGLCSYPALAAARPQAAGAEEWIVSEIIGNVTADMQVDPKDDFHTAVNQSWMSTAQIPQGNVETAPAVDRSIEVREQMLALLNRKTHSSHAARQVRLFYEQYTDMETRNALGIAPLLPYIEEIQALATIEDVREYVIDHQEHLGETFAKITVDTDHKDSTAYIVSLNAPVFSLDNNADEYRSMTGMGKRIKAANEAMFIDLLVYAGMTEKEAKRINDDFFALESEIAKASMGTEATLAPDFWEKIYNPMTVEEIDKLSPNYPATGILQPYIAAGVKRFNVTEIQWLKRMNELFVEENLAGLKAYLIRSAVKKLAPYLDQTCMDFEDERRSAIYGIEMKTSIEDAAYRECASSESMLAMAAGKMYTDAYVSRKTKAELEEITEDVIAVYRRRLENNSWLTEKTRAKAIEKLDTLKVRMVYPDDWSVYDFSTLSFKSYKEGGSLIENFNALRAYDLEQKVKQALSPVDSRRWIAAPQMVNAAYSPNDNSINIFAGILGDVFYDADAPIEAKLGTIGMIIGHEISHGFDSNGSQFDKHGNLVNWWTREDMAAFEERTAKVSAYFSQFEPLPGIFANGELEKGEAVADLGGMSCMLEIAKDIPDFDYALFFESYATVWRRMRTAEAVEQALLTDPHPLNYLRTNAIVQQFEEFYETYGVEEGDGMYLAPEKRLAVW